MRNTLSDLIKRATKPSLTPMECYELQVDLISMLRTLERQIRRCTKTLTAIQQRKRRDGHRLAQLQELRGELEWRRSSIRLIGDSLVFRFVPDHVIRKLNNDTDPGWVLDKQGTRVELRTARKLARAGEFAFIADTTHCIRVGDVYSVSTEGGRLIEVKSGGESKDRVQREREARQTQRIELVGRLLDETLQGFLSIETGSDKNYWSVAETMLRKTPRGPQIRAVEPGLLYCAFRRKDESMLVRMLKSRIPHKFLLGALSRRAEDLPIIQPFPLHLSCAISRAIIDGRIDLFTIIDLERVTKDMRRIGFEPVGQNYTLRGFRSAAGDALAGTFLLDSVLYACGSLREAIESYENLIQACRDYSYTGSNSKQCGWSSVEPFLQIGIDMPGELKRMIAKNITATGAPPLFRVGMSKRRTSN